MNDRRYQKTRDHEKHINANIAPAEYAKSSMRIFLDTVYRQMRLVTGISVSVQIINYLLAFSIAAVSIALWSDNAISVGAIAIAVSLALRLNGMSQWIMWELSSLFENIGTVTDGMNTLSKTTLIQDSPDANTLVVEQGRIDFNQVSFHYGENTGVIDELNLTIKDSRSEQPMEDIRLEEKTRLLNINNPIK